MESDDETDDEELRPLTEQELRERVLRGIDRRTQRQNKEGGGGGGGGTTGAGGATTQAQQLKGAAGNKTGRKADK